MTDAHEVADEHALERLAAQALEIVAGATVIGLGTGHAASAFVRALGAQVRAGRRVRGVPTSEASAALARASGIPLTGLDEVIDVTVDGADEVDPDLNMIKGYGGALVRERIVAAASHRQLILVGNEKLVPVLGSHGRLPVEVVPFALPLVIRELSRLGRRPTVRTAEGQTFRSDNGNVVVDCAVSRIERPAELHAEIRAIPGVVDTGLFIGTAHTVLVADGPVIRELSRSKSA